MHCESLDIPFIDRNERHARENAFLISYRKQYQALKSLEGRDLCDMLLPCLLCMRFSLQCSLTHRLGTAEASIIKGSAGLPINPVLP